MQPCKELTKCAEIQLLDFKSLQGHAVKWLLNSLTKFCRQKKKILQQFQAAMSYLILVKDKVHDEMFPVLSDLRGPASVLT